MSVLKDIVTTTDYFNKWGNTLDNEIINKSIEVLQVHIITSPFPSLSHLQLLLLAPWRVVFGVLFPRHLVLSFDVPARGNKASVA